MTDFTGLKVMPFSTPLGAWDTLSYLEIFETYDVPVLFSALDDMGKIFLCVLIEDDKRLNRVLWLFSEISAINYQLLRNGDIDFRKAFTETQSNQYILVSHLYESGMSDFSVIHKDEVNPDWLPLENEYLDEDEREELGAIPAIPRQMLVKGYETIKCNEKTIENTPYFYDLKSNKYRDIYDSIKVVRLSKLHLQSSVRDFDSAIRPPLLTIGFKGRGYSEKYPDINLWEEAATIVTKAYRKAYYASRKRHGHSKPISYPSALGLAASVTFELFPDDDVALFEYDAKQNSEAYTLTGLANTLESLKEQNRFEADSAEEILLSDMMLQAVEELAPSDTSNYEYVEIHLAATPTSQYKVFTITEATRENIIKNRLSLATKNTNFKTVEFVGVIYEMSLNYTDFIAQMRMRLISNSEFALQSLNVAKLETNIDDVEGITRFLSDTPVKVTALYDTSKKKTQGFKIVDIEKYGSKRDTEFTVS